MIWWDLSANDAIFLLWVPLTSISTDIETSDDDKSANAVVDSWVNHSNPYVIETNNSNHQSSLLPFLHRSLARCRKIILHFRSTNGHFFGEFHVLGATVWNNRNFNSHFSCFHRPTKILIAYRIYDRKCSRTLAFGRVQLVSWFFNYNSGTHHKYSWARNIVECLISFALWECNEILRSKFTYQRTSLTSTGVD